MKKLIIFVIVIFLLLGIAGFWYWQKNFYSKEVLKLEILGPNEITIAQEVEYTVKYKNNGNTRLEEPRLIFEFPENSVPEAGKARRQEISSQELGGDIYPGDEKTFKFKGRLFGQENDIKTAKAWLTYSPKNLKARYESSTTFSNKIKAVPLTLDFDMPSKIEVGREFKFYLNYFSTVDYPLTNLRVKVNYPDGFEFVSSTPKALDQSEWDIPLLNKAQGGRIEVRGKLSGDVSQQRIFLADLGIWLEDNFIPLKEVTKGVEIGGTLLSVFQQINGSENYIAKPGDLLHYEIFFRNISGEPFINLFLLARLDGAIIDFDTFKSDLGQFNQGDNSIVWDWRKVSQLSFLAPGEEGRVEFWINLKDNLDPNNPQNRNLFIKNKVLISQVSEEFETKVASKLVITQKAFYNDEIFGNTGPLPPQTSQATTYTVIWRAQNYYNDVKNVRVKAVLPRNVVLTGKIFPEEEISKFSFDNQSREIIWRVSDGQTMSAGQGVNSAAPNIAFQVSLTPDWTQKGAPALIINESRIAGDDQWTGTITDGRSPAINTTLPDDTNISDHSGIIQ